MSYSDGAEGLWRNESLRKAEQAIRNAIIEECARAVLAVPQNGSEYIEPEVYVAAIRALKS